MGISCAPELFQRKMHELLSKHDGCEVIMDDIIIYGKDREEHDKRLEAVVKTIKESGLKLNKEKCQFHKNELIYFGHIVGAAGVKANPEKVKAIQNLQPPKNVSELKTVLGMVNYLTRFSEGIGYLTQPLTSLLRSNTVWHWDEAQQSAFEAIKEKICNLPTLSYYRPDCETIVSADASSFGLGGAIMQKQGEKLVPIAFCSRTLTAAEQRYAQIEKECLASVWVCEKFSKYLVGLPSFELLTDHKPLVPLMMSKDLNQGPVRCQRLLMRLMRFNPHVTHVPGKELVLADTLSRHPLPDTVDDHTFHEEVTEYIDSVQATWPTTEDRLHDIKVATARDPVLQLLAMYVTEGWPENDVIPNKLHPYRKAADDLSVSKGVITYGDRIVIPPGMRTEILDKLHESHQGITKCREKAKAAVWWPGISQEINDMITACAVCQSQRPTQRHEPLIPSVLPSRPWERLGADLCEFQGRQFLVVVDYFSRWIEIKHLTSTTSVNVIVALKQMFSTHGIPDHLHSDNGPQFVSKEFEKFASSFDFKHTTSSPYMSQANGEAERAVQTAKNLLKQPNFELALLNYRSTPTVTGISPSEALMGRRLRTRVPTLTQNLVPQSPDIRKLQSQDREMKQKYKISYDQRHGAKPLRVLNPEDPVLVKLDHEKGWDVKGKVVLADQENRSYLVRTPTGVVRRNRKHLQPVKSPPPSPSRGIMDKCNSPVKSIPTVPSPQRLPSPVCPIKAPEIPSTPQQEGFRNSRGRLIRKPLRFRDTDCNFVMTTLIEG